MIPNVYTCDNGNFIHCYLVTDRYTFVIESPSNETSQLTLNYVRNSSPDIVRTLNYSISLPSGARYNEPLNADYVGPIVHSMSFVNVPQIKGGKMNVVSYIVFHLSDGLQLCSLETLLKSEYAYEQLPKVQKWHYYNKHDYITSFHEQGYKDGSIRFTCGTMLSSIIQVTFNTFNETFHQVKPLPRYLQKVQDDLMDGIINISSINYFIHTQEQEEETNWATLASASAMCFSSLDNTVQWISNKAVNKEQFLYLNSSEEQNLLWVDYGTFLEPKTLGTAYFLCNMTNSQCILYKCDIHNYWEKLHVFQKNCEVSELQTPVDCKICFNKETLLLQIICGSDNNKLYKWEYNLKTQTEVDSKEYYFPSECQTNGLVHNFSRSKTNNLYFLCNNNTCIKYISL